MDGDKMEPSPMAEITAVVCGVRSRELGFEGCVWLSFGMSEVAAWYWDGSRVIADGWHQQRPKGHCRCGGCETKPIFLEGFNFEQRHGKARVRVARVWRSKEGRHFMVEWNVSISLLSDSIIAYVDDDNSDIVATDTIKNTVYAKAKECKEQLSVEEFAILLAKHFTSFYRQVTSAIVRIVEKPWECVSVDGQLHEHGFKLGSERHTTEVTVQESGTLQMTSGIEGLALLKTTKSGFEGFIRDKYTALPDTQERMLATEVTSTWRYSYESVFNLPQKPLYFTERYLAVKKVLMDTFFGPPKEGVYSASVQSTLYQMAKAVLGRSEAVIQYDWVQSKCYPSINGIQHQNISGFEVAKETIHDRLMITASHNKVTDTGIKIVMDGKILHGFEAQWDSTLNEVNFK
ncbi:Uricase [Citrus sinensis]|nr:Uricase [Citrus sinensis]